MQLYATRAGKTSIEVIEGTFGRYMKLTRDILANDGEKKTRWLNISDRVWNNLNDTLEEIMVAVTKYEPSQGEVDYRLSSNWFVTVYEYRGEKYIGLKQLSDDYTNRMNFSLTEWGMLTAEGGNITNALNGIKPQPSSTTLTSMRDSGTPIPVIKPVPRGKIRRSWPSRMAVYKAGETVWLTEEQALYYACFYELGAEVKQSYINMISARDLALLVGRYEFNGKLTGLRKDECNGCLVDHPSQMQHSCLMDDWNTDVQQRYADVKEAIPIAVYQERVRMVFENLKLPLDLKETLELYESDTLKEVMLDTYSMNPDFDHIVKEMLT